MLTSEDIARGKAEARCTEERLHEHDDCIRFAYEWLDAQTKLSAPNKRKARPIKHIIERWAGRYVSTSDVEVAAHMHPGITGEYPYFNISSRLVHPNQRRLAGLGQAHTQNYTEDDARRTYASEEL